MDCLVFESLRTTGLHVLTISLNTALEDCTIERNLDFRIHIRVLYYVIIETIESLDLLMCGGGVRSILLFPLVTRYLETIDVCICRMCCM